MNKDTPAPAAADTRRAGPLPAVVAVLTDALRALGDAGEPEAANRLAARAYVALRRTHPDLAQRINGLMHRLARLENRVGTGHARRDH